MAESVEDEGIDLEINELEGSESSWEENGVADCSPASSPDCGSDNID